MITRIEFCLHPHAIITSTLAYETLESAWFGMFRENNASTQGKHKSLFAAARIMKYHNKFCLAIKEKPKTSPMSKHPTPLPMIRSVITGDLIVPDFCFTRVAIGPCLLPSCIYQLCIVYHGATLQSFQEVKSPTLCDNPSAYSFVAFNDRTVVSI